MEVDVAIIGGGPAGSTLAAILASHGRSVELIDRESFPRDKVCGEFLSYDALPIIDALGIDLADAPAIVGCRVVGRHRTLEFEFPVAARGISRLRLDALLFDYAVRCGAQARTQTTVNSIADIQAKTIVGAWGRWGRLDTQLDRPFVRDHSHRNFGFKCHYRGPQSDVIELYSFDRGYLGVSAIEGGETNICGLVHESRLAGHKGKWEAFVEAIRDEEPPLDAMYGRYTPAQHFLSSEPVIFRAKSVVENGIVMIGDASGIVDPLTGNGMAMAMQSALLAAPFILSGDLDGYRQAHHDFFEDRIRWSRRVAALLSRPKVLDNALRGPRAVAEFLLRKTRAQFEEVERLSSAVDLRRYAGTA